MDKLTFELHPGTWERMALLTNGAGKRTMFFNIKRTDGYEEHLNTYTEADSAEHMQP